MIVMDELIKGGYTPEQAAAVAGHATEESQIGALPNPKERAAGIIHWTPVGGRRNRMDAYLREQGIPAGDYASEASLRAQARYFQIEARTTEAGPSARFLRAGGDVTEAARALRSNIRYATATTEARAAHARGHLQAWRQRQQAAPATPAPRTGSEASTRTPGPGASLGGGDQLASLRGGEGRYGPTPFQERYEFWRELERERDADRHYMLPRRPEIPGGKEDFQKREETGGGARITSLGPMGQRALIDGAGATGKWEGSADININVNGPRGTDVRTAADGFKKIRLARTPQMPVPDAGAGWGAPEYYE